MLLDAARAAEKSQACMYGSMMTQFISHCATMWITWMCMILYVCPLVCVCVGVCAVWLLCEVKVIMLSLYKPQSNHNLDGAYSSS